MSSPQCLFASYLWVDRLGVEIIIVSYCIFAIYSYIYILGLENILLSFTVKTHGLNTCYPQFCHQYRPTIAPSQCEINMAIFKCDVVFPCVCCLNLYSDYPQGTNCSFTAFSSKKIWCQIYMNWTDVASIGRILAWKSPQSSKHQLDCAPVLTLVYLRINISTSIVLADKTWYTLSARNLAIRS